MTELEKLQEEHKTVYKEFRRALLTESDDYAKWKAALDDVNRRLSEAKQKPNTFKVEL